MDKLNLKSVNVASLKDTIKILKLLLELYPELQVFLRIRCLSKGIREEITADYFTSLKAIYY